MYSRRKREKDGREEEKEEEGVKEERKEGREGTRERGREKKDRSSRGLLLRIQYLQLMTTIIANDNK